MLCVKCKSTKPLDVRLYEESTPVEASETYIYQFTRKMSATFQPVTSECSVILQTLGVGEWTLFKTTFYTIVYHISAFVLSVYCMAFLPLQIVIPHFSHYWPVLANPNALGERKNEHKFARCPSTSTRPLIPLNVPSPLPVIHQQNGLCCVGFFVGVRRQRLAFSIEPTSVGFT